MLWVLINVSVFFFFCLIFVLSSERNDYMTSERAAQVNRTQTHTYTQKKRKIVLNWNEMSDVHASAVVVFFFYVLNYFCLLSALWTIEVCMKNIDKRKMYSGSLWINWSNLDCFASVCVFIIWKLWWVFLFEMHFHVLKSW